MKESERKIISLITAKNNVELANKGCADVTKMCKNNLFVSLDGEKRLSVHYDQVIHSFHNGPSVMIKYDLSLPDITEYFTPNSFYIIFQINILGFFQLLIILI